MTDIIVCDKLKAKSIEVERIEMRSDGADLTAIAEGSGIGVWLKDNKTRAIISLQAGFEKAAYLGAIMENGEHVICIGADEQGGWIQLVDKGQYTRITVAEIMSLLSKLKALQS